MVTLTVYNSGIRKNVEINPGIPESELQGLLESLFNLDGRVVGLEDKYQNVLSLSVVCRFATTNIVNSNFRLIVDEGMHYFFFAWFWGSI
jgi:hypothetical protein